MATKTRKRRLAEVLPEINGRRRERLLSESDIIRAGRRLQNGQYTFLHGGHVANAYKYPAYATGAAVWRHRGRCYCELKTVSATRGSTGFGQQRCYKPPEDKSAWIAVPDAEDNQL